MSTPRLHYIDQLKVLGVYLVVLGHLPLTDGTLMRWIFSFHMPLFFFVSGYLFRPSVGAADMLTKCVRQLLLVMIPYFLINLLFDGFQTALFYPPQLSIDNLLWSPLSAFLLGRSQIGWMWFLWALLWMRLAYYACHRIVAVSHRRLAILAASLALGWWVYDSGFRYNDYQITAAVLCFPFYCIGAVAGRYRLGEASRPVRLVLVAVCLAAYVALFGRVGQIDISSLRFGGSYLAFIGIGTAAVVLWLLVLSLLPHPCRHASWIVTLSSGTLVVLGFHIILVQMFKLGYKHLLHITAAPPYMDTLGGVLIAAAIVAILYLPARYILRSGHGWLRLLAGR